MPAYTSSVNWQQMACEHSKDSSLWARIDTAFKAALAQQPEQRQDWVKNQYAKQPEICNAVLALLVDEKASKGLFNDAFNARDQVADALLNDPVQGQQVGNLVGSLIGQYRLEELIASGGMGAVYRAERADGEFEQTVAIKILPGWATDPQTIARLKAERQILANLQHPNITALLDGGQTTDGIPYLVLEFIHGEIISEYVKQTEFTLENRLRLFENVADAIHYAHQNLVIHRDIKPTNILVDKAGNPKLLDFGIAKLLDMGMQNGPSTEDGFTPMTPEYASPEQRAGQLVTTASDIYQLGILLFHLLTGFHLGRGADTATRPSTAVLELGEHNSLPSGVTPAHFAHKLKGDLDTIVLKAMRENPQERYSSAADMAADIRRHLNGEAIEARPETWWAATRRLSRNHPVATSLTAALFAVVIIWASSMFFYAQELKVQRDKASHQALRANQVKGVLIDIFRRSDPLEDDTIGGKTTTVWDSLDAATAEAYSKLADVPDIQAELFTTLAVLYRNAGMMDKARALQYEAVGLLESLGPDYAVTLAIYRADYASILNVVDGWAILQESLRAVPGFSDSDPIAAISILLDAAHLKESIGEFTQALKYFRQAADIFQLNEINNPSQQIELLAGEAKALIGLGQLNEAEELLLQALKQGEAQFGSEHRRLAIVFNGLDKLNRKRGNYEQAIVYSLRLVSLMEADSNSTNDSLLMAKNNLALSYGGAKQVVQEQQIQREIIALKRNISGGVGDETLGFSLQNLASSLHRSGDYLEALEVLTEAAELLKRHLPADSIYQAYPHFTAALIYTDNYQPQLAKQEAQTVLSILEPILGDQHYQVNLTRCVLAEAYRKLGKLSDARMLAEPALQAMLSSTTNTPRYTERCRATVEALDIH